MPVPAKLEVTLKINQLPPEEEVKTDKNGWKEFTLDAGGRKVQIKVRPRMWTKLVEANTNWKMWVAAITGGMGHAQSDGFVLTEPAIQVFEMKPREPPPPVEPPPVPT